MLQAFVPKFALQFCVADAPPTEPAQFEQEGSVLIADISGFTARAASLSEPGRGGAEEIQSLVNAVFAPLVNEITAAKGDVVCFAGDAVVAWWPGRAGAGAALHAAKRIHSALAANPAALASGLSVRAAIVSGDYWLANVGNTQRWFPLVGGAAFKELSELLAQAPTGETLCCIRTRMFLDQEGGLKEDETGGEQPGLLHEQANSDEALLSGFVLPGLRANTYEQQADWLAELRQATIVFASLATDCLSAGQLSDLQNFAETVSTSANRKDGSVNQLVVDDKGLVAVIAFGVAGHVHEDDPLRAVLFAADVRELLQELGLDCRIGVATGRVFCGNRGGICRSDFAVIGHCVNHAARLMMACTGSTAIAVDEATASAAAGRLDFVELAAIPLKNLGASNRVFVPRLAGAPPQKEETALNQPALEGRASELAAFELAANKLTGQREGDYILLLGAAGIGKTVLLQGIRASLQAKGVRVLRGAGDSIGSATPYLAWRQVLQAILGTTANGTPAEIKLQLARLAPTSLSGNLALLNPMLPVPLVESAKISALGPEARLSATRDLLVALLHALAAAEPLALIIEDGHWLDDLSRGALIELAQQVDNLLLIVASRPGSELLQESSAEINGKTVELSELGEPATAGILRRELAVEVLPEALAQFVYSRTGGHPLFVQQLAASLRAHPAVVIEQGVCRLARHVSFADLELPLSIAAVVTSTLDSLRLEQQVVLKVMAVFGRPVLESDFSALLPAKVCEQQPWLDIAPVVARQLLVSSDKGLDFRHALIRQSIYEVMTQQQRASLHGGVADLLEARHATVEAEDSVLDTLAFHNERAGRTARAIDLFERAGTRALQRDIAPADAIQTFTHLIDLERNDSGAGGAKRERIRLPGRLVGQEMCTRRARWQRMLGEAYAKIGETTSSFTHLREALEELGLSLPLPRRRVVRAFGLGLSRRLILPPGPVSETNLDDTERAAVVELVAAHDRFARACYTSGESVQGIASALHGTSLAELLGPSSELCNSYCMMSNVVASFGRFDVARRYTQRAAEAAETLNSPALEALTNSLPYLWTTTLWEAESLGPLQKAIAIYESLGDLQPAALFGCFVSRLHMLAGNYDQSAQELGKMDRRARESGATYLQIRCKVQQAELAYRRDNFLLARDYANEALANYTEFGEKDYTVTFQLQGMLALLARLDSETVSAERHAEQALDALVHGGAGSFFPHLGFAGIFEVLIDRLRRTQNEDQQYLLKFRPAIKLLRSQQRTRPYVRPQHHLYDGRLKILSGQRRAGRRALEKGLVAAEKLRGPWEVQLLEKAIGDGNG